MVGSDYHPMKDFYWAVVIALTVCGVGVVVSMRLDGWDTTPRYAMGQCLLFEQDREPWEVEHIWKIEMVGKRSYLVRVTPANIYKPSEGVVLSFTDATRGYRKVPCPPKT